MSRSRKDKTTKDQPELEEEAQEQAAETPGTPDTSSDEGESQDGLEKDNGEIPVEEQITKLQDELQEIRQKADENLDGWQRALAEFSNFKKRTERENTETRIRLKGEILMPLLDVYDDLKLAMPEKPREGDAGQWAAGIEMIFLKFQSQLKNMGVEVIDEKEVPFDPNLHEAIASEESDEVEEGHIIDVFQSGYRIGERVIRPARVRVAR